MGYQIHYEGTEPGAKKPGRFTARLGAGLLAMGLLVSGLWPRWADQLRQVVLPGNPAVTAAAWEDLTQQLRTGEPLSQALEAFCRSILRHGN